MPGSTPATSQLDWLSSTTAMIVLSWAKATRDLVKSFSLGIGALRQLFASDDGAISFAACPIPSLRWRKGDSNPRSPPQAIYTELGVQDVVHAGENAEYRSFSRGLVRRGLPRHGWIPETCRCIVPGY